MAAIALRAQDPPPEDGGLHVDVTVLDARGNLAARVPVVVAHRALIGSNGHEVLTSWHTGLTDAKGFVRLPVTLDRSSGGPVVLAGIAANKRVGTSIERDGKDTFSPVTLQLPPTGMVRVLLYDEKERPLAGVREVTLALAGSIEPVPFNPAAAARPAQLEAEGAMFHHVGLGLKLRASVVTDRIAGTLTGEADGPTRPGELVVIPVRLRATEPIVRARVLDPRGAALAHARVVLVAADTHGCLTTCATTDAEGRLQGVVASAWAARAKSPRLVLLYRGEDPAQPRYGGAAEVLMPLGLSGIVELGELRLVEEPVLARGRVIDIDGKGVAGVRVTAELSHAHADGAVRKTSMIGNVRHEVVTDPRGDFELRELAPKDTPVVLSIDDLVYGLSAPVTCAPRAVDVLMRAVRAGSFELVLPGLPQGAPVVVFLFGNGTTRIARAESADGTLRFENIAPGKWMVSLNNFDRPDSALIEDLQIKEGEVCQDERLLIEDWRKRLVYIDARVRSPEGEPLNAAVSLHVQRESARVSRGLQVVRGRVQALVERLGTTLVFTHERFGTETFAAAAVPAEVTLGRRPRVRLTWPPAVAVPEGLMVALVPALRDVVPSSCPGTFASAAPTMTLYPTVPGAQRLVLLAAGDRFLPQLLAVTNGREPPLWEHEITVTPDGPAQMVTMPITAAEVAAIKQKLAAGQAADLSGKR